MLDERKAAILRAVVQEYITTGQPVGSSHVARSSELNVSPATIRNEMAVLEQEGYLHQPHTSAGRVPTDRAYRAYVDHLAMPGHLDAVRAAAVRDFFHSTHGALERMLADTSRLLAKVTNYAAVVVAPTADAAEVRSVQLVALSPRVVMAVAVLANGSVENESVEWDEDLSELTVSAAGAVLAAHLSGRSLVEVAPLPETGDADVHRVATAALDALRRHAETDDHLYIGGASSLASAFEAVDVVRSVLHTLEEQYVVVSLLRDLVDRGLSVAIGTELGVQPLAACSVVVAPYLVDGEPVGTVGLLGPTRMNYPQALAVVDTVSRHLGERLSEGDR